MPRILSPGIWIIAAAAPAEHKAIAPRLNRPELRCILTGIGKANAAAATTHAVLTANAPVQGVLSLGIAGSLHPDADIPHTVIATETRFADEGADRTNNRYQHTTDFGFPITSPHPDRAIPNATEDGMAIRTDHHTTHALAQQLRSPHPIHTAPIATVSTCAGTDHRRTLTAQRAPAAIAEAMEGAAVALAAARLEIPRIAEVRVISNHTGDNPRWNLNAALEELANIAAQL